MARSLAAMALALFLAVSCAGSDETPAADAAADTAADTAGSAADAPAEPAPAAEEEKPMSHYEGKVADIRTSMGTITIRFFPDEAPNHVRNFIDLAESGFYDGIRFHRVVPGFVIQGGDPNTKTDNRGAWGTGGSGKNVSAEFNDIPHKRGILSMARSGHPDSASSQFFIVVKESPFLDGKYSVFGEVVTGMDVADQIVAAAKGKEQPDDPVTIESVTVRDQSAS
ncbi:MAG TPA: peptidylprolyl isomerase [Thermoanaerobaculia bacterium]|nr:peptidylprolyl isomerase [Thermoanaerobaculia bacterium]